jgi:hypothetical protein
MMNLMDMLGELIKTPVGVSVPIPEVPGDWTLEWLGWKPFGKSTPPLLQESV